MDEFQFDTAMAMPVYLLGGGGLRTAVFGDRHGAKKRSENAVQRCCALQVCKFTEMENSKKRFLT
ncbi:hypothetical protein G8770_18755 [Aestuariicella hydrocarbonica]|uniref:Uncharacterized protein n=1 Tax=Pseudomaricurvus hydrocarbonicus TaxID=1470433 RepID=A0A9E5T284_9GAMM|nr:hypothetical protein [Aestuariicella hydrocarbonica]NHO67591.1 hypothetical protein [Aestuariicella hydrocarbonica]